MVSRPKESALVAQDIMASPVVCVEAHEELGDVEQRLVDAHITGVPVLEKNRLVGIITRSDFVRFPILLKALDEYVSDRQYENGMQQEEHTESKAFRSRLGKLTAGDVMTTVVVTCAAGTPLRDVAAKMISHHVHRVVVVDNDQPIGIVGSLDLVKLLEH